MKVSNVISGDNLKDECLMKSIVYIVALTLLSTIHSLSQDRGFNFVPEDKLTLEKRMEVHRMNSSVLNEPTEDFSRHDNFFFQDRRGKLSKEQPVNFFESKIANSQDSRKIIMKSFLDNGFLLIESIRQYWDGYSWINSVKSLQTYDEDNNQSLKLHQFWDGIDWTDNAMETFAYDSNNNRTEWLYQALDGSIWLNVWKETYTYDGNNNQTALSYQRWDISYWRNVWRNT